jgi:hypothetical protein
LSPEESSAQQWSAITTLLDAQLGPTGKLPTVANVQQSVDLYTGQSPAIGVQLVRTRSEMSSTKKMKVTSEFVVLVSVKSEYNALAQTPPNLSDANAQLQEIIANGNGHGVVEVLRDPANINLGGMIALLLVTGTDYSWEIGRGAAGSDQVWSHALISVQTTDFVGVA